MADYTDPPMTRQECRTFTVAVATRIVAAFTPAETRMVAFGMFPAGPMREAEQELASVWPDAVTRSRELAVAVMDVVKARR